MRVRAVPGRRGRIAGGPRLSEQSALAGISEEGIGLAVLENAAGGFEGEPSEPFRGGGGLAVDGQEAPDAVGGADSETDAWQSPHVSLR